MPELPEVERARKLIHDTCRGYKIKHVDSLEDKIVYTGGTTHDDFWLTLSGKGRFPVMHFGMTGMIQQLKGQEPTWYRRRPKESPTTWPPRFYKFVLELEPQAGSVSDEPRELAFIDGRRLGRLRLIPHPVIDHPPVSLLGFDPVLSMPSLEEFQKLLLKKKGTVKGVIMDQAFSAGVGNWVADERVFPSKLILYQAHIHPSCPIPHLSEKDVENLHHWIRKVPLMAVEVNADSLQFPDNWLFRWRWVKGKKVKAAKGRKVKEESVEGGQPPGTEDVKPKDVEFLALPNGKPATIEFIEVGGRTTALVKELQKMPEGVDIKPKISKGKRKVESDRSEGEVSDTEVKPRGRSGRKSRDEVIDEIVEVKKGETKQKRIRSKRKSKKMESESEVDEDSEKEVETKDQDENSHESKKEASNPIKKQRRSGPSNDSASRPSRPKRSSGASKRMRDVSSELSDAPE
ncbi:hypothetical protein M231_04642 [Tremella mesenterica]|uniref:Formamidopyrimidine-DNA glycosylase catalytic domain-containing protein n=1 Tax=Tremella mesenterica TaxID=5217 RepID=A0A4Q1BK03_TREME|nr:hypothetical protein M231_04642 [Tremella mesenterica]